MQNAWLDESKTGIKIAWRNINDLRSAGDTTLTIESEDKLKNLLMRVKENKKAGLKLNIKKTNIMASGPITWWEIDGETVEKDTYSLEGKLWSNYIAYSKAETLLCQQRSI